MKAVGKGWRALALAALVAGCGDGGGTSPSVATTVTATSSVSQTAVAGAAVADAPAVRVLDQRGDPMPGVSVSFTAIGGGAVSSPAATTDAGGVASAGGWTLGPTAGSQSVSASVGSLAPVTFGAVAQARVPTTAVAGSAITQTALTGAAVAEAPAVRVNDQTGQPMAGIPVTFAVTAGGGQVASATATTNAAGLATSGTWTLGAAGQNTVTATVAGVAPVQFSATAQVRVPTTLTAYSPATQTGIAGLGAQLTPVVLVTDQAGQPLANVTVTFAVTEGGGTLSGPHTTTTGPPGVPGTAVAGTWVLGPVPGRNVVTATVAGLVPVEFEATGQARAATSIHAVSSTSQVASVGTAVSLRPSVRVDDQEGRPMPGVAVTFAVTAGGGTVTGGTTTTDAVGVATVGSWTLGPAAGPNTLTATVPGLALVQFQATGTTQVATTLTAASSVMQLAPAGTAVPAPPSVRVADQDGQPMAGVQVTFAVMVGGGTLTGATATTNAAGVATVGSWRLGSAAGPNQVNATVAGLTPVIFLATGTPGDPCTKSVTYTPGTTVSGSLATTDCRLVTGEYVDFYDTSLPSAQALTFNMSSTAVDSWLELYDAAGNLVGFNDDASSGTNDAALRVFAPSGAYFLAASSVAAGETGAYQISSSALPGNTGCSLPWVIPNVTIAGSVASTDCSSDGYFSDVYLVVLRPGQTLNVLMQSTAVDAYLGLVALGSNTVVDSDDDSGGGSNALMSYTYNGTATAVFYIDAGTYDRGETGSYTLTVTRGTAGAQQQVRTGPLPTATAARGTGRPVPARMVRQARSTARPLARGVKAVSSPAARRPLAPRTRRPAPRG